MKTKLYEHQEAALKAALQHNYFALFMEMGTGKTLTALALFEKLGVSRMLVICPKLIMQTWDAEISKHLDFKIKVLLWASTKCKTIRYQKKLAEMLQGEDKKIFIVNAEAFSVQNVNLKKFLSSFSADICALDESSKIKNYKANRTKRILKMTNEIKRRYILTGTEITNSVLDIYTQFQFLKSDFWPFKNYFHFRGRYAVLEERYGPEGRTFKVVTRYKRVHEILDKINPHCFRVKKADCLDLPEKIYQTIPIKLNAKQRKLYDHLKNHLYCEYANQILTVQQKSVLFMRFRQLAGGFMPETGEMIGDNLPKLDFILDETEDLDNKVIIWSCFTAEIEKITELINAHYKKQTAVSYYGKISQAEKEENLTTFKNDPNIKYLVANAMSGAYGLNLQHSNIAYWYSRPLSPEQNMQAEDRQHRIGQKNAVIYKDLPAEKTVEERILKVLRYKKNMVESFQDMSIKDFFNIL